MGVRMVGSEWKGMGCIQRRCKVYIIVIIIIFIIMLYDMENLRLFSLQQHKYPYSNIIKLII